MIDNEYVKRKCTLLIERLEKETKNVPGYLPAERQLRAAEALLKATSVDVPNWETLDAILLEVKEDGTMGFELWNWGHQLKNR